MIRIQNMYYSLQQQKVKTIKLIAAITELVVVWSVCNSCVYMYRINVATVTLYTDIVKLLYCTSEQEIETRAFVISFTHTYI